MDDLIRITKKFMFETFVNPYGLCAIIAIHGGKNMYDSTKDNPHAHVLLTTREVTKYGFSKRKNRSLDKKQSLLKWRKVWEQTINREYQEKNLPQRISRQSNEVQGIDREPSVPLGRASKALEDRGIKTPRGNKNREIEERNRARQKQNELELILENEHQFEYER
jgi:hypothetical protein